MNRNLVIAVAIDVQRKENKKEINQLNADAKDLMEADPEAAAIALEKALNLQLKSQTLENAVGIKALLGLIDESVLKVKHAKLLISAMTLLQDEKTQRTEIARIKKEAIDTLADALEEDPENEDAAKLRYDLTKDTNHLAYALQLTRAKKEFDNGKGIPQLQSDEKKLIFRAMQEAKRQEKLKDGERSVLVLVTILEYLMSHGQANEISRCLLAEAYLWSHELSKVPKQLIHVLTKLPGNPPAPPIVVKQFLKKITTLLKKTETLSLPADNQINTKLTKEQIKELVAKAQNSAFDIKERLLFISQVLSKSTNPNFYVIRADLYRQQGRLDLASQDTYLAIALAPHRANCFLNADKQKEFIKNLRRKKIEVCLENEDVVLALKHFNLLLSSIKAEIPALMNARLFYASDIQWMKKLLIQTAEKQITAQHYELAEKLMDAAVKIHPSIETYTRHLAFIDMRYKQTFTLDYLEKNIEDFFQIINLDSDLVEKPGTIASHRSLVDGAMAAANQLAEDNQVDHAINLLQKVQGAGYNYKLSQPQLIVAIAKLKLKMNRKEEAHELYEQAQNFSPNNPDVVAYFKGLTAVTSAVVTAKPVDEKSITETVISKKSKDRRKKLVAKTNHQHFNTMQTKKKTLTSAEEQQLQTDREQQRNAAVLAKQQRDAEYQAKQALLKSLLPFKPNQSPEGRVTATTAPSITKPQEKTKKRKPQLRAKTKPTAITSEPVIAEPLTPFSVKSKTPVKTLEAQPAPKPFAYPIKRPMVQPVLEVTVEAFPALPKRILPPSSSGLNGPSGFFSASSAAPPEKPSNPVQKGERFTP